MGKFDIDAKFNNEYKLTKSELLREVMDEYDLSQEEGTIRRLFDKMIDHMTNKWRIDIRGTIKGSDEKEKFDALKILKLLYVTKKKYGKNIIKILDNPSLENIELSYHKDGIYSKIVDDLYNQVKTQLLDAKFNANTIITLLNGVNKEWSAIIDRVIQNSFTVYYKWYPKVEKLDLKEMNSKLQNCLSTLEGRKLEEGVEDTMVPGIMEAFFIFLHVHKMLCEQIDDILLDELEIDYEAPSEEYCKRLQKEELTFYPIDIVTELEKYFINYNKCFELNDDTKNLISFILYDKEEQLSDKELQHYKAALKKTEKVIKWMLEQDNCLGYKNLSLHNNKILEEAGMISPSEARSGENPFFLVSQDDKKTYIHIHLLVSIIQEIYFVQSSDKKKIIENRFYGYNNSGQTLTAVLENKNDDINRAKTIAAWNKRIENRIIMNLGGGEVAIEKRKAHITLLKIKKYIYKYNCVGIIVTYSQLAMIALNLFFDLFKYRMQGECGMHDENTVFLIHEDGRSTAFPSQEDLEASFPGVKFQNFTVEFKRKNTKTV